MYWKLLQVRASRVITIYFDEISYGWSLVIKLHCGENRSQIVATELDLWLLIAGTK